MFTLTNKSTNIVVVTANGLASISLAASSGTKNLTANQYQAYKASAESLAAAGLITVEEAADSGVSDPTAAEWADVAEEAGKIDGVYVGERPIRSPNSNSVTTIPRIVDTTTEPNPTEAITYEDAQAIVDSHESGGGDPDPEDEPSTFGRDPSSVGGPDINVAFDGFTATVTGTLKYYEAGEGGGAAEGWRAGFEVQPPSQVTSEQIANATFSIDGGSTIKLSDQPNASGDPRKFWWYPDTATAASTHTLTLDWDGSGPREAETFTVIYNVTLGDKPEVDPGDEGGTESEPAQARAEGSTIYTEDALNALTIKDLTPIAESLGIDVKNLKKAELVSAIWEA